VSGLGTGRFKAIRDIAIGFPYSTVFAPRIYGQACDFINDAEDDDEST
jgi:hypothetical protein